MAPARVGERLLRASRILWRVFAAAPGIAATALLVHGAGAANEQLRYNPATCSTDADGKVYLRLNTGVAFGFPADALQYLRDKVEYDPPPVPNPDDPEGCPGNPILTPSAYLLFHFPAPVVPRAGEFTPDIPLVFSIIGAVERLHDQEGYLGLQGSTLRMFEIYREMGNWCEVTPAGWDVCYAAGVTEKPEHPAQFAAAYVARENMHKLRSGAPITLHCGPPCPPRGRQCPPYYQPLPRVSLSLRFYDDVIPAESFFDLDRAITDWLKAARVPELDFEPPGDVL